MDATLVAVPRQRNTEGEKARIEAGETAEAIWRDKPAKARQKDVDARWTVKFSKAKPAADGRPQVDIAIPEFGYKSHISIDRRHGIIRRAKVTDAAAQDGARLREGLIDPNNTASDVWADSADRSAENERSSPGSARSAASIGASRCRSAWPAPTPPSPRCAPRVEHPFAHQKGLMGMVVRTIGLARATAPTPALTPTVLRLLRCEGPTDATDQRQP